MSDPVYMSNHNLNLESTIFKNLSWYEVDWLAIKMSIALAAGCHDIKAELRAALKLVLKAVVLNTLAFGKGRVVTVFYYYYYYDRER